MNATIETRVKQCIIDRLNLKMKTEDIDDNAAIFAGAEGADTEQSLGLDSIDALELIVALGNEFGVKVSDEEMHIFQSIKTIADFIREKTGVFQP